LQTIPTCIAVTVCTDVTLILDTPSTSMTRFALNAILTVRGVTHGVVVLGARHAVTLDAFLQENSRFLNLMLRTQRH